MIRNGSAGTGAAVSQRSRVTGNDGESGATMTEPVDTGEDSHSPAADAAARPRVSDGTWRWIVLAASALGAIASTVSALISFLPFVPPLPTAVGFLFWSGALAITVGAALRAVRTRPGKDRDQASAGPDRDRPYRRFKKRILVAVGLLAVVSVLSSLIATQGGSPEIFGGHYYLHHNGPEGNVEISRAAYLRAVAEGQRVISGVCALWYTLIFLAAWHAPAEQGGLRQRRHAAPGR